MILLNNNAPFPSPFVHPSMWYLKNGGAIWMPNPIPVLRLKKIYWLSQSNECTSFSISVSKKMQIIWNAF